LNRVELCIEIYDVTVHSVHVQSCGRRVRGGRLFFCAALKLRHGSHVRGQHRGRVHRRPRARAGRLRAFLDWRLARVLPKHLHHQSRCHQGYRGNPVRDFYEKLIIYNHYANVINVKIMPFAVG